MVMPNLIRGAAPLTFDFVVSLPHSLLATVGLVCAAPDFEGLSGQLWQVRNRVPPDLLHQLCLLVTFPGGYQRLTTELMGHLPPDAPAMDFRHLRAHLEAIPDIHYQMIALRALARGADPHPEPAEMLDLAGQPERWAAYLADVGSEVAPGEVAGLVRDAAGFKQRLVAAIARFWHEVYAQEFEATRPLMERSVAYLRAQSHSPSFDDTFLAITGRLVPERLAELLPSIARITFVPSCYVGPYVAFSHHRQDLVLFYNCRATPPAAGVAEATALYPPLRALADETRLQILSLLRGRELYAQEIVDQLDISQPAVSRHLNLMATAGILKIRREGNAKYYSVDGERLARLADALRTLV
jgi:hypothetical protein